jgi:multisubunit Na+/H+ antiporter MnhG subunit
MTWRIISLAIGVCITAWMIAAELHWAWIAFSALTDTIGLVSIARAAYRGEP